MAILLPALKSAREMGKRISCANLEKQLYLVFLNYFDDNAGNFVNSMAGGGNEDNLFWYYIQTS